ncbi:hypothetical protein OH491_23875 [Termitidicoccus mucosus]|uniref:Uncharacterized protein n=1 Tax=Termitidicoccus mucosus TaxID=1184151 RepID=A0A178IPC7_9BACT|nr:hypothetical protein AW736_02620 [Opitutaceae bacterium TSB47]
MACSPEYGKPGNFTLWYLQASPTLGKIRYPPFPGGTCCWPSGAGGNFKTLKGLPEGESGFEIVRLDCQPGAKPGTLLRAAQLRRLGEAAVTFGEKRAPTVGKYEGRAGIRVDIPLAPGRHALYLPDRAFEFEVK